MHVHKYIVRLTGHEKRELRQWSERPPTRLKRRAKTEARLADRARILLWAHDGVTIDETATRLDCGRDKLIFWRRRFLEGRAAKLPVVERLRDQPRSGRPPPLFPPQQRETVVLATLAHFQTARREGVTVCSSRDLAHDLSHGVLGCPIAASPIVRLWDAARISGTQDLNGTPNSRASGLTPKRGLSECEGQGPGYGGST